MQNTTHEEMLPHHGQLDEPGRKAHDTDICNLLNTQRRKSAKRLASNMLPNSLGLYLEVGENGGGRANPAPPQPV